MKRLNESTLSAPETKRCFSCGQDMHRCRLNDTIVFYIHRPEEQEKCAASNPHTQEPLIWCNGRILAKILEQYYEEVTGVKPPNAVLN